MNLEPLKIRLNRWGRRQLAGPRLHLLDGKRVPHREPGEVWMLMVCKNEELRLPDMLRHHFAMGISRVLMVDNGSTDGTLDILRRDKRIHVFQTKQSFAGNKVAWQEILLRRYGIGHWNLLMDADELFAYPGMEKTSLPEFVCALGKEGSEAIHSLFIEMFPKEPLCDIHYHSGDSLLAAAPWFDADGYVTRKYNAVFGGEAPSHIVMGGTRARIFGGEFGCSKYPLFKYQPHQFLRLGLHTIEGARLSPGQCAVLHFKYLQDFHAKVLRESQRSVYWNGGAEYKAYAAKFEENPTFSLWHPGAVRFESPAQLASLGLLRAP